jgi:hypothetical protein
MKNTFKLLGIIALLAIIGFSIVGCDPEIIKDVLTAITFKNNSSYTVSVETIGYGSFDISPGGSKKINASTSDVGYYYEPTDKVRVVNETSKVTFYNR